MYIVFINLKSINNNGCDLIMILLDCATVLCVCYCISRTVRGSELVWGLIKETSIVV